VEDYGVVYLGSAIFKIARLTFIALFFVHLFACIFYRVKETSAESPEDVAAFYSAKRANVSFTSWSLGGMVSFQFQTGTYCNLVRFKVQFTDALLLRMLRMQDLPSQYVRTNNLEFCILNLVLRVTSLECAIVLQLVCFYYVLTTFTTVGYGNRSFVTKTLIKTKL
jgi:hypothetical protein